VGLVSVRFKLFDEQMGDDFPGRMLAHAERSASLLEQSFEVVRTPLIEDDADAHRVGALLAADAPDAVVFAPAMAAPPSYARAALGACDAPLVIWNAPSIERIPADYHQDEATVHSTTVGALMFANVLVRDGRRAPVVTAAHGDRAAIERLTRTVRAAAVAGSLRQATLLRVGDPIAGYLDIEADAAQLEQLGVREVALDQHDWEARVAGVDPARAAALVDELDDRWSGDPGPEVERSARVAVALEQALDEVGAIGGTVNCHGPWFRGSETVGIPACLGVACSTQAGRPLACTGDQTTAIVLCLARRLTGAALYCETYLPEIETGLVLVAAGGEGDPAWADPPTSVRLESNDHYPGVRGQGTSVAFALRRGPASLLSFSPEPGGWVLAWGPGRVEGTRYRDMRGPNAMFRFDSGPSGEAISRWIASGATHHNALAPGSLEVEMPVLAEALGVRLSKV
jgi:L-arabinose isomerase